MGAGGTWRAVFRKHVLIASTREDVFSEQQNTEVCDRGRDRPEEIIATDKDRRRQ
jgi:hypothetical protein